MFSISTNENMLPRANKCVLAATKQLYEWFSPFVRLSVCDTFFTMFPSPYHHEILSPRTEVMSIQNVKVKGQGHRGHNPT